MQGEAYDPLALNALFAQGGIFSWESVDVDELQDMLLAQYGENSIIKEELEIPKEVDLLSAVLSPGQLQAVESLYSFILGKLTPEQKEDIKRNGLTEPVIQQIYDAYAKDIEGILAASQNERVSIEQLRDYTYLKGAIQLDLRYGEALETLAYLKANNGKLDPEYLIEIGVFPPGTPLTNGLFSFGGSPSDVASELEMAYYTSQYLMTPLEVDREYWKNQQAGMSQWTTMVIANAVAGLVDWKLNGPASAPLPGGDGAFNLDKTPGGGNSGGQTGGGKPVQDGQASGAEVKAAEGARETFDNRPYLKPNSRPSFRKGVVESTWNNAKGPDGLVRDPNTGDIINWVPGQSRRGIWDMGHVPGQKYNDMYQKYFQGELTPKQFRDWYNNPNNYRPEIPQNNRGHLFEQRMRRCKLI